MIIKYLKKENLFHDSEYLDVNILKRFEVHCQQERYHQLNYSICICGEGNYFIKMTSTSRVPMLFVSYCLKKIYIWRLKRHDELKCLLFFSEHPQKFLYCITDEVKKICMF